jgi:hypothetical protein
VPTAEPVHTTEWFLGSEPTRRTPASAIHTEPPETQLPPTVPKGPLSQEAGPSASWPWSASCYCPCWTPGSPTPTSKSGFSLAFLVSPTGKTWAPTPLNISEVAVYQASRAESMST